MAIFDPITELELNLDNLYKELKNYKEEIKSTEILIKQYENALDKLKEEE